jgi:hypothetical protein
MPVAFSIPLGVAMVGLVAAALLVQLIGWFLWEWFRTPDER